MKQSVFFKHVRRNIFYSKNYLFGFVSALTVSCMLLRCAVQYDSFEMHIFRSDNNNTATVNADRAAATTTTTMAKKINNFWLLETCHCASRAIERQTHTVHLYLSDLRMSEVFE